MTITDLPMLAVGWSGLDTIILSLFFLALVGVVVWVVMQQEETSSDYFLAGKKAGWLSIGSSIFASNIGSEHLVGLAGAGFVSGMAMAHWEMQGWMILILAWVFVPFYDRIKIFTMPEFLEHRFSSKSRIILSLISLVSYVLTKVAVTVYSGGIVFGTVFGIKSISLFGHTVDFFWVSAIGLVVITGIYTVLGGMKAIMYTSVLQTPVLLIGSVVLLVIGLHMAGGWDAVMTAAGSNIHLIRSIHDPEFPWTGVIFGSMIIGFWYWCTDQYIVQRVLSGRNQQVARRGAILAGYLKLLPVFIFLIPGMIAFALFKQGKLDITDPNAAFSVLVAQLLPIGFKGIVVCGLLAALMSSLASLFNSSAALFVGDFYQKLKPNASEKHLVVVGRIATTTIVVLGILWIPVMKLFSDVLYQYLQAVQGLLAPAIAAAFLMGVFWKRANASGCFIGMTLGFAIGMFRLVLNIIYGTKVTLITTLAKLKIKVATLAQADLSGFVTQIHEAAKSVQNSVGDAGMAVKSSLDQAANTLSTLTPATQSKAAAALSKAHEGLSQLYVHDHGILYQIAAINWLHFCVLLFIFCVLTIVVVSLATKAPDPGKEKYTYYGATPEEKAATRRSWNGWDIFHSVVILAIIAAFYWYFW